MPGDPLCGFLLAGGALVYWNWIYAVLASLLLYSAGLLLNDVLDLREDTAERPHRPLPSGMVQPVAVWVASSFLLMAGLGLAALGGMLALKLAAVLILAIAAYDGGLKRVPVLGVATMGMCRAFSVLLGACFAGAVTVPAVVGAGFLGLYVAAVTGLARHETRPPAPRYATVLPLLTVALGVSLVWPRIPPVVFLLGAGLVTARIAVLMLRDPDTPIPLMIGHLIRNLLLIQAGLCVVRSEYPLAWVCAAVLMAFWPLSRIVAKRFYAS